MKMAEGAITTARDDPEHRMAPEETMTAPSLSEFDVDSRTDFVAANRYAGKGATAGDGHLRHP